MKKATLLLILAGSVTLNAGPIFTSSSAKQRDGSRIQTPATQTKFRKIDLKKDGGKVAEKLGTAAARFGAIHGFVVEKGFKAMDWAAKRQIKAGGVIGTGVISGGRPALRK